MKIPRIVLVRGLPGSGKTTFCYEWISHYPQYIHIELDHFRYNSEGVYEFNYATNYSIVDKFHKSVKELLKNGAFVIVSGVFAKSDQIFNVLNGHNPHLIFTMYDDFKSIHAVPPTVMEKFRNEFESNAELRIFNSKWNLLDVTTDASNVYISADQDGRPIF